MATISPSPEQAGTVGGDSPEAAVACFHCGLPVPAGSRWLVRYDGADRPLCCPGCEAVARTIVDQGFVDYYRHRSALPQTPREALPGFLQELAVYDLPDVQRGFVREAGEHEREAALILEGIRCAACVWLNERHLAGLPGVTGVEINYTSQRARVRWDERRIQLSGILRAVADIGYTAHPFDAARQEEAAKKRRRTALWQIFVAGFGMMQVMMYAIPAYIAGEGEMPPDIEKLMRFASLALTLPVILYSCAPFFQGAWRDLRARRAGMDVPVALGIAIAFAASVWSTFTAGGEVYYDSVSMFVFFLLTGRYLEAEARSKAAAAAEELVKLIPATAHRIAGFPAARETETVPVARLEAGDHVMVRPGEAVPADGVVAEGASELDESLLTGESRPVARAAGDALTGGSINVSSPLVMRVSRVGEETTLAAIVRLLDRALAEKPRLAMLADRVAGWLVAALLAVSAVVFGVWMSIDPSRALAVTVSLLVVTCPCALSLATPAALAAATGRLSRMGVLVTRGHALETLARATHFVFDKTGTLTVGRMRVTGTEALGGVDRERALALAAALERGSEHAIARAICAAADEGSAPRLDARDVAATPGGGIEGTVDGGRYRLGTPAFVSALHGLPWSGVVPGDATLVLLGDERGWLGAFQLADAPRPDAARLVSGLRESGVGITLLSGDRREAAEAVASKLGIAEVRAGADPAAKLAYVTELQFRGETVAAVGDGVNDAPLLARAQVSIAMGEGTQVAHASADMILLGGHLGRILEARSLARATERIIRQNFAWAIGYNLIAVPLAAAGLVTPWLAGLGMAASSLIVVLNALRLTRRNPGESGKRAAESRTGAPVSGS